MYTHYAHYIPAVTPSRFYLVVFNRTYAKIKNHENIDIAYYIWRTPI